MPENDLFEREELPYLPPRRVLPLVTIPTRRRFFTDDLESEERPLVPARRTALLFPPVITLPTPRKFYGYETEPEELSIRLRPVAPWIGARPRKFTFLGYDEQPEEIIFRPRSVAAWIGARPRKFIFLGYEEQPEEVIFTRRSTVLLFPTAVIVKRILPANEEATVEEPIQRLIRTILVAPPIPSLPKKVQYGWIEDLPEEFIRNVPGWVGNFSQVVAQTSRRLLSLLGVGQ